MKKFSVLIMLAVIAAGCSNVDRSYEKCLETYAAHPDDSLGLSAFKALLTGYWDSETALAKYEESAPLIRNNELIITKVEAIRNEDSVLPGMTYKDIAGPDALTGDTLSISGLLGAGKPVLVDFWASWCPPCRKEIKDNLVNLAAEGKVNIIGIAVWEDSVDNTRKAIEELGISWPVIYTGGRKDSPSIIYGVRGIPTLFLLSPEGTILGSGHSIEEIEGMP